MDKTHSAVNCTHASRQELAFIWNACLYATTAKALFVVLDAFCAQSSAASARNAGALLFWRRYEQVMAVGRTGRQVTVWIHPFLPERQSKAGRQFCTAVSLQFTVAKCPNTSYSLSFSCCAEGVVASAKRYTVQRRFKTVDDDKPSLTLFW